MICECGLKMKCTFTLPEGNIRYRVYWCKDCKKDDKTVEIPVELAGANLKRTVRKLERYRFNFYKALRKTR